MGSQMVYKSVEIHHSLNSQFYSKTQGEHCAVSACLLTVISYAHPLSELALDPAKNYCGLNSLSITLTALNLNGLSYIDTT